MKKTVLALAALMTVTAVAPTARAGIGAFGTWWDT